MISSKFYIKHKVEKCWRGGCHCHDKWHWLHGDPRLLKIYPPRSLPLYLVFP